MEFRRVLFRSRVDAVVADDPVAVGWADRDLRAAAARGHAGCDAGGAGGAEPRFLRLPPLLVEPLQAAAGGTARRAGAQSLASGHRLGLPPADALRRLCQIGRAHV